MTRYVWMTGLVLLSAATALAQNNDNSDRPGRGRRGRDDAAQDGDQGGRRGRDAQGDENGGRGRGGRDGGGRDGGGRFGGGMFGRPNPMFEAIDANHDGSIDEAELKKAVSALKKLDADSDGKITMAEASPQGGPGGMGDPSQMVDRWMQNDKNGDGKLTPDEVPEFMTRMLQGADTNGDGAVDKEELTKAAEGMRDRFGRGGGGPGGGFGGGPGGGGPGDPAQMLRQYDKNNDGKLTSDEVPGNIAGMLRATKADANGDGAVDAGELRDAARKMQEQFGGRGGRGPGGRGNYGGNNGGGNNGRPQRPASE